MQQKKAMKNLVLENSIAIMIHLKKSLKGALNPNILNLTINREKFWL